MWLSRASGEYTWMDYEATLSRAVLVKPLASSLTSYPDVYEEGVTCVTVSPDFQDLNTVVNGLLADEPRMQRIADTGYQRLLQHVQERYVTRLLCTIPSSMHASSAPRFLWCRAHHLCLHLSQAFCL